MQIPKKGGKGGGGISDNVKSEKALANRIEKKAPKKKKTSGGRREGVRAAQEGGGKILKLRRRDAKQRKDPKGVIRGGKYS